MKRPRWLRRRGDPPPLDEVGPATQYPDHAGATPVAERPAPDEREDPPVPAAVTIPHVPPGTRLSLYPDDWADCPGWPDTAFLDVYAATVGSDVDADGMVPVAGHLLDCTWERTESRPCTELRVSVAAIQRCLAGLP